MRCINPLHITWDGRNDIVPCGRCNFCLESKRAQWSFRVAQELKVSTSAHFLTLTYADENLPWGAEEPTLVKSDYQLFMKKLRKAVGKKVKLRYYAVGEYGTQLGRPHYHSIMFNLPNRFIKKLEKIWGKGTVYTGSVEAASIHYVTGYTINRAGDFIGRAPPFSVMSRNPGIGKNYLNTHTKWHQQNAANFTNVHGQVGSLPRYYKDKIFDKATRETLSDEAAWLGIQSYREEISRLAEIHADPERYYLERLRWQHDKIKTSKQKL